MASLAEQVRIALYGKLNVAGVTNYVGNRLYDTATPQSPSYPFVVFTRQAPGAVTYTLGGSVALEDDLWMVKACTTSADSTSYSPQELADLILMAARTAIGTTLTLSAGSVQWIRRFSDIPPFAEMVNGQLVWHHGFLLRIAAE